MKIATEILGALLIVAVVGAAALALVAASRIDSWA